MQYIDEHKGSGDHSRSMDSVFKRTYNNQLPWVQVASPELTTNTPSVQGGSFPRGRKDALIRKPILGPLRPGTAGH
jgi:hypothetical protein